MRTAKQEKSAELALEAMQSLCSYQGVEAA